MSLNVGLGGRQGASALARRLRAALAGKPESRASERILDRHFWRPRAPASGALGPTEARVLPLRFRVTPRT